MSPRRRLLEPAPCLGHTPKVSTRVDQHPVTRAVKDTEQITRTPVVRVSAGDLVRGGWFNTYGGGERFEIRSDG